MRYRTLLALVVLLALLAACTPAAATYTPTLAPAVIPATTAPTLQPAVQSTTVAGCDTTNEQARQAYDDALAAAADDPAGAEVLLRQAIALDPAFCDAMDDLGQLLRSQDRLDEAIEFYKQALVLAPDYTAALTHLGITYSLQGDLASALNVYTQLTQVAPNNPEGYYGVGSIHYITQDYILALDPLKQAEALYAAAASPYLTDVRYLLGMSYFYLMQLNEARPLFLAIYDQMPEDGSLNYSLGLCYLYGEPQDVALARKFLDIAASLGILISDDIQADLASTGG